MAYMSQENKKEKLAALKKIIPASWKWSLGVEHHSTLRLRISEAPIDLVAEWNRVCADLHRGPAHIPFQPANGHIQVNEYYLDRQFDKTLPLMQKIKAAMMIGNHDRSDSQTDYFDVGWYVSIDIGKWDKPFVCTRISAPVNGKSVEERIVDLESENAKLKGASNLPTKTIWNSDGTEGPVLICTPPKGTVQS